MFKIPLYVLIGIAINFCIIFSLIDLFNFLSGLAKNDSMGRGIIDTHI